MSTQGLQALGEGRFAVSGPVGFDNAAALLQQSEPWFADARSIEVDLQRVTKVDSAALALLIEWQRRARQHDQDICFTGMPPRLQALAQLSGVADFLRQS